MKNYKQKRKELKGVKREIMERGFESSTERKNVTDSFKRESRSLKRSEKNAVNREIRDILDGDDQ